MCTRMRMDDHVDHVCMCLCCVRVCTDSNNTSNVMVILNLQHLTGLLSREAVSRPFLQVSLILQYFTASMLQVADVTANVHKLAK